MQQTIVFPSGTVDYHFIQQGEGAENPLDIIKARYDMAHVVFITNEHIFRLYPQLFKGSKCLVLPPSEQTKDLTTISAQAKALMNMEATRKTLLVAVGGGVITDIAGFLASVYMRGISFGFIPTSLLGMVDAAIGGKNGVNLGLNKNMIGTIRQPEFIIFDTAFLNSLPGEEWSNGFAEVIKYACIFDAPLFEELGRNSCNAYKTDDEVAISKIIERCVAWKNKTVLEDESEQGVRKLLNFGHTAAHAIEHMYELSHGKAVGIGMIIASMLSERVTGLDRSVTDQLKHLLSLYHLPVKLQIDAKKAMEILKMDKKRNDDTIDYILLEKVGKAVIKPLPFETIEKALATYDSSN
jgi:3-dehydroquinate synthase